MDWYRRTGLMGVYRKDRFSDDIRTSKWAEQFYCAGVNLGG